MKYGAVDILAVRCVADVRAILGEGPLWDPRINRLLFVDIKNDMIFVYDPESGGVRSIASPGMISAIALAQDGYVCAHRNGFAKLSVRSDAAELIPIADPESELSGNRFNDGKVDPSGGFWAGSMDIKERDSSAGNWWRLGPDGKVEKLDTGFHVTNGPAFDLRRNRVYFTDSARQIVYVAKSNGSAIAGKEIFLQFGGRDGYPDGMEVDSDGCLWIAFWDGAAVRRFSPEGDLVLSIEIPVPRPTSIAIVGDRLYVTSARGGLSHDQINASPQSGGLFELTANRAIGLGAPFIYGSPAIDK